MKARGLVLLLAAATSLPAAYQYYYSDSLHSIDTTRWTKNGYAYAGPYGFYTGTSYYTTSYPGSITSRITVPDGTSDYEVKAAIPDIGGSGSYWLLLRSTGDAMPNWGTYYAAVLKPKFVGGVCSATLEFQRRLNSQNSVMASTTVPCHDGMVLRAVARGQDFLVYSDDILYHHVVNSAIAAGRPGIGAVDVVYQKGITPVYLGTLDRVPPTPVASESLGISAFLNAVQLQWAAAADDPDGIGVSGYALYRDGQPLAWVAGTSYLDESVVPGSTYTYSIRVQDYHGNESAPLTFDVTTPSEGAPPVEEGDGRRLGVRKNGSYWGASGEQIDTLSGNLNFTIPLFKAMGRGGWGVTFPLSYNSQIWRKDQGGLWKLGRDLGYGYGWRLQAGSLTPAWSGELIDHYTFIDSTGAAHRLDVNTNGVWSSAEGVYVWYDTNTNRLYFPDGSFWVMGCESAGTEQDAGSRYPTLMQDSNGNQIWIRYQAGKDMTGENSSARIAEIEDVRAVKYASNPDRYHSWSFTYDTGTIPHLTDIQSWIGEGALYSFSHVDGQVLTSPFSPPQSIGIVSLLTSVTRLSTGVTHQFSYAGGTAELARVDLPYGAYLRWSYRDFLFSDGRTLREVENRYFAPSASGTESVHVFSRDPGDAGLATHSAAFLAGPQGFGQKAWFFAVGGDAWRIGLETGYEERPAPGQAAKRRHDYTWTRDAAGNPYIVSALTTLDPGAGFEKQTKREQTLDLYGNLTELKIYDFGNLSSPARAYTNTYLTGSNYSSRYILNRLVSATVSGAGGGTTLVTNSYDSGFIETLTGLRQHDTANYGASMKYRGNVTTRTGGGKTLSLMYDITGTLQSVNDLQGHSLSIEAATGTNYAAPGVVTPNSNASLAESYTYTSFLGLATETGPNGSTASLSYDGAGRPSESISPHGAKTTYSYSNNPPSTTATTSLTGSPTEITRWVKTSYDGLGRPVKVEQGYGTTTVSVTDTEYAACACSPLGKMKRVSQPYAPGGAVYWTTYDFDGLGRTLSVTHPGNSGITTYVYEGNTVKVTDPASKWKKFVMDAFGNLVKVIEPNPSGGADLETTYAYNARNQLTGVTMPRGGVTQTRAFNYDLSTGRLASATNPENGTVSYTYNADGTLATKIDARNQKVEYVYDSYQRVTQVKRYVYRYGSQQEDACQRMTYSYDTNPLEPSYTQNGWGRLTAVSWGGSSCTGGVWSEMYSYKVSALAVKKKLQRNPQSLEAVWTYDQEGKVVTVKYPNGGLTYTYTYDPMGRPVKLTDNSADLVEWVNNVAYNAAGQMTQMTRLNYIGDLGPSHETETREYNARNQLTRLRVPNVIDHEYRYSATANDGRITQRKDWLSGEEVSYQYDSLNRLISAVTTGPEWGQSFGYDGFGNLLNQTVTKGSAPSLAVNVDGNTNRIITGGYAYDANGNLTAMPLLTLSYDVENRLAEATHSSMGTDRYGYDAANRRVWKRQEGSFNQEFTYFYGVDGRLLGTYGGGYGGLEFGTGSTNVWFGGKLIWAEGKSAVTDRLGSVVNFGKKYYPYGEEPATTQQNHTKFATYYRDETTALDYAVNRYYGRTIGRFLTPDPYLATPTDATSSRDPSSWNRYVYVQGDPINFNDRFGLMMAPKDSQVEADNNGGGGAGTCVSAGFGFLSVEVCVAAPGGPAPPPEPKPVRTPRLIVKDDCYWEKGTGYIAGWTRVITYQIVDQDGRPFYGSEVPTVREVVTPTGGIEITGNGVWQRSDNSVSSNGTFVDFLSSNGQGTGTADQVFKVDSTPLHVDIGSGNPAVLHNTYTNTGVTVNKTNSPRPCKEGDPIAR